MKQPCTGSQDVATPQKSKLHSSFVWTRAQDGNMHNSVYGGWLLRASLQSAVVATETVLGKALPIPNPVLRSCHHFAIIPSNTSSFYDWRT